MYDTLLVVYRVQKTKFDTNYIARRFWGYPVSSTLTPSLRTTIASVGSGVRASTGTTGTGARGRGNAASARSSASYLHDPGSSQIGPSHNFCIE